MIIKNKRVNFSLEFFLNNYNSKKLIGFEKIFFLKPNFITVTYNKLKINKNLIKYFLEKNITIIPHLICKTSVKFFNYYLNNYYIINLKNILLIKGDQKLTKTYYSYNFINILKLNYKKFFKIILGCYPEIHWNNYLNIFEIKNIQIKNSILKKSLFITQYFYNSDSLYYYLDNIHIFNKINVIPSIMMIFCLKKIINFSNICKTEIPLWFLKKLENNFHNYKKFKKLNFELFFNFFLKIILFKINFVHFYTMNNIYFANIVCENLNNIINI